MENYIFSDLNMNDQSKSYKEIITSFLKKMIYTIKLYLNFEILEESEDYDKYIING